MPEDTHPLRQRMAGLDDAKLVRIITVEAADYQEEALDFARAELDRRGVDWTAVPPGPSPESVERVSARPASPTAGARIIAGLATLRTAPRFPVTSAVGALSVAVTLLWWLGGYAGWGLMSSQAFELEPWRFVTSTLVHLGIIHLGFNLYWLWVFGRALEAVLGSIRVLVIIVVLAVVSAAAEYAIFIGGVGLSGVTYGLFTLSWVLSRRDDRLAQVADRRTVGILVGWFLLCIVTTATGILIIANAAHAAGAAMGTLVGLARASGARTRTWSYRLLILACTVVVALAATTARPMLNLDPEGAKDPAQRGARALQDNDNETAVEWLRRATAYRTQHPDDWHNLGVALGRLDRYAQSVEAFRRALELEPSSTHRREALARILATRAYLLLERGETAAAEKLYQEAVQLRGDQANWWHNLGVARDRLGQQGAAKEAFRRAERLERALKD